MVMPIPNRVLRSAGAAYRERIYKTQAEALQYGSRTAFLCHSHLDKTLVKGLVAMMQQAGWAVYVDWADSSMPEAPNRETAMRIKERIRSASFFIFLATKNSMASRWCPWEIGYADGAKSIDSILITATTDDDGLSYGNEYLQLYRRIEATSRHILGVFNPEATGLRYLKEI